MKHYLPIRVKYIPPPEQAAVQKQGTAACFYSTKSEHFLHGRNQLAVSKSVDKGLSWPIKDKHREKWAKQPTSLVIMLEGQIRRPLFRGG